MSCPIRKFSHLKSPYFPIFKLIRKTIYEDKFLLSVYIFNLNVIFPLKNATEITSKLTFSQKHCKICKKGLFSCISGFLVFWFSASCYINIILFISIPTFCTIWTVAITNDKLMIWTVYMHGMQGPRALIFWRRHIKK